MKTFTKFIGLALALSCLVAEAADVLPVSIIDAPDPLEYRMENHFHVAAKILLFGGPTLVNSLRNNSMSARLTTALYRDRYKPTAQLIAQIESNLNKAGISVADKTKVAINPTKPDQVNYGAINSKGTAILHVYLWKIGLQSRTSNYQPFIQASYCLVLPTKPKDCSFNDWSYYGDGYTEEDYLVYPADISDQWIDEDDVMRRTSSVEEALSRGIFKIADGISSAVAKHLTDPNSDQ